MENKQVDESTPKTTEKEKNSVQKIFNSFSNNLNGVNSYFKKFEQIAIGEDESMKDETDKFYKDIMSEMKVEMSKIENSEENILLNDELATKKSTNDNLEILELQEVEVEAEAEVEAEVEAEEEVEVENYDTKKIIAQPINDLLFEDLREEEIEEEVEEEANSEADPLLMAVLKKYSRRISKRPKLSPKNFEILSRGTFLMLNNYFEYLLADLLTYYYNKFKNSLDAKEFKISLQELNEYENIEELTKSLILKEVENIIVEKTFDQLLDHFEKSLNISLEKDIINWEKIIEIRERRHLIVHNSSIVNKKYITRTKNPYNFNIGDNIHIDKDYFHFAYKQFKIAGEILLFNSWGSWDKHNIDNAIHQMLFSSFDSLNAKDYDNTLKICRYCDKIKSRNEIQEDYLLRIQINKAIAYKKQNNKSELSKVLKLMKIGTSTPIFKIAFQILNDDKKDLTDLFKKAILLEELIIDYYLEWPIFDFVKNEEPLNKQLLETFKL